MFQTCEMCILSSWSKYLNILKYLNIWIPREDVNHWIYPVLLVSIRKRHYLNAVSKECSVKKSIQQKHLSCKRRFFYYMQPNNILFFIQRVSSVSKLQSKIFPNHSKSLSKYSFIQLLKTRSPFSIFWDIQRWRHWNKFVDCFRAWGGICRQRDVRREMLKAKNFLTWYI